MIMGIPASSHLTDSIEDLCFIPTSLIGSIPVIISYPISSQVTDLEINLFSYYSSKVESIFLLTTLKVPVVIFQTVVESF